MCGALYMSIAPGDFDYRKAPPGQRLDPGVDHNSFSGTDIQCFFFGENIGITLDDIDSSERLSDSEKTALKAAVTTANSRRPIRPFAELQSLTVSRATSVGPVRRLGETEPVDYKLGAGTFAGSMVFAMINKDIFTKYIDRTARGFDDNEWTIPNALSNMPPFNIMIRGANEYGRVGSGLLEGVRLTNFGTTFSVDDLYTEATYNYVARNYFPFVDDVEQTLANLKQLHLATSATALSSAYLNDQIFVTGPNGKPVQVSRKWYEFLQQLPNDLGRKLLTQNYAYKLGNFR